MIKFAAPFLLSDLSQIPHTLIDSHQLSLEGAVIDADNFREESYWRLITSNIQKVKEQLPGSLLSLHFPTTNANYLESKEVEEYFIRFLNLAIDQGIHTVVSHSNHIETYDQFDLSKIDASRRHYLSFYERLDGMLENKQLNVCIENMPVIGDHGVDFDSIFVFPEDFADFDFRHLKVTWDICHWSVTCSMLQTLSNFSSRVHVQAPKFDNFYALRENIGHIHFSSFNGLAYPLDNAVCHEGIPPQEGDINPSVLNDCLKELRSWPQDLTVVLEIAESSYLNRIKLTETIAWLRQNGFIS